jgi:signal transduction histidine kinase
MAWLGVTFEMNGRPVGWLVAASFGGWYALLGFLLGAAVDARRRDRRNAEVIRSQIETIALARARLAEKERLAALGQLATAIAHEVRNPLAVIRSAAQGIAENRPDDEPTRRACSFVTAEIDRLTNVVSSLLAFARPTRIEARPVAVADLFERTARLAEDDVAAKGVRLLRASAPSLVVSADFDLACQVLLGLVVNAAEASPPGGEIRLEAARRDGAVEIAVEDTGPGVPAELRDRVFDAFFTTRPRGVGLGLAVARQIVEAHGGRIDVGDGARGGARFAIRLPAAGSAAAAA